MFLLLDHNNIVRCMASEECNLHKDKRETMRLVKVSQTHGTVGDHYDPATDTWTPRPENHPQPSAAEQVEAKIQAEIASQLRAQAVVSLKQRGELPEDFQDIQKG